MASSVKSKKEDVYLLRKEEGGFRVLKLSDDSQGPHVAAEYKLRREVSGYICDCPGFVHRSNCKHTELPNATPSADPVSLPFARDLARDLLREFSSVFRDVSLAAEPYDRDASGNVSKITLLVSKPINGSCILTNGSWEAKLKGSGVLLRVEVR